MSASPVAQRLGAAHMCVEFMCIFTLCFHFTTARPLSRFQFLICLNNFVERVPMRFTVVAAWPSSAKGRQLTKVEKMFTM
jgi:hypothetical protein